MTHPLHDEAVWAATAVRPHRGPADSAVLFVSWNALEAQLQSLAAAWDHPAATHAVAIKAQPHPAVLRRIVACGFGLEAASWEEVVLARAAACPPERLVFDSPVKRPHEIADCARHSPGLLVNANCLEELERLAPHASHLRLGLRLNPMVGTSAPDVFQVSGDESKFGEPITRHDAILDAILRYPIEALHVHSGSSMKDLDGAVIAMQRLRDVAVAANRRLAACSASRRIRWLNIGGGLAPEFLENGQGPRMQAYAARLRTEIPELWSEFQLVTEFGQWTHAHTGYALSDIEFVLQRGPRQVAYLHLGADFMLRDAYRQPRGVTWVPLRGGSPLPAGGQPTDLAGPLCFAGDYLEKNVPLPTLREGDELLFLGTGANAYGLWSRHTSRTLPACYGVDFARQLLESLSPRFNPFL